MVKGRRASENPLAGLDGLNVRTDRRHDRRALTVDEARRLLAAAERGPVSFGMTGPERALAYRLAAETGLRAGEVGSLTRSSFVLDGPRPTVTVAAAYSKRPREDVLPLRRELAAALRGHLAGKPPGAQAFNVPPKRGDAAKMIRRDLEAAGIDYRNDSGRVADFHALRHTFITNLARSGVHPKVAQTLARHSTITLTIDRYTDARMFMEDEAAAVDGLPDLDAPAEAVRKTGTDDGPESSVRGAPHGAREADFRRTLPNLDEQNSELSECGDIGEEPTLEGRNRSFTPKSGGEGGIRTPGGHKDHAGFRNRSDQPLWHLSARGSPGPQDARPATLRDIRHWAAAMAASVPEPPWPAAWEACLGRVPGGRKHYMARRRGRQAVRPERGPARSPRRATAAGAHQRNSRRTRAASGAHRPREAERPADIARDFRRPPIGNAAAYPFRPVRRMPRTRNRWAAKKRTTSGRAVITLAAIRRFANDPWTD